MSAGRQSGPGRLMTVELAAEFIRSGRVMAVAGDETALAKLPKGLWIGGTIAYFIGDNGGVCTRDHVFVDLLPADCGEPGLCHYDPTTISQICTDAPENGFTLVILPAFSGIHQTFAHDAPNFPDMYLRPLVGWVSGVHLDELATRKPKTLFGPTGEFLENAAVAMHVPLPPDRVASLGIVNLFRPGSGPRIRFPRAGFAADLAMIDGKPQRLSKWLTDHAIDTRLPLVADYCGAMINVSIRSTDAAKGTVDFYAPVFKDIDYAFADPVASYSDAFERELPKDIASPAFSCNCILNYLYGGLEGKSTGRLHGPVTFGEIAYQLVNQTLVHISVEAV